MSLELVMSLMFLLELLGAEERDNKESQGHCAINYGRLACHGLSDFSQILVAKNSQTEEITEIEIKGSISDTFNMTLYSHFPQLQKITMTNNNISNLVGNIPIQIRQLELENNFLKRLEPSLFSSQEIPRGIKSNVSLFNYSELPGNQQYLMLEGLDLRGNKLSDLPMSIFYLPHLRTLKLLGNVLNCEVFWERSSSKFWNWRDIIEEPTKTHCKPKQNKNSVILFEFPIQAILDAREDFDEVCTEALSICRRCDLYGLQRGNSTVSVSLKVDCSKMNLTELPPVPNATWELNVSGNDIRNLSALSADSFRNLLILNASHNYVDVETLTNPDFLRRYNYLDLTSNGITHIPTHLLQSMRTMEGHGLTNFANNSIYCDCDFVTETKPLLIENYARIKDKKFLYCSNVRDESGQFESVWDLKITKVCDTGHNIFKVEESRDLYMWAIVVLEVLLIVAIVSKVWYDQRQFRRTGILPWCSSKMPRLPCDAMLESLKKNDGCSRPMSSANSSNINVNATVVSRELRSSSTVTAGGASLTHGSITSSV